MSILLYVNIYLYDKWLGVLIVIDIYPSLYREARVSLCFPDCLLTLQLASCVERVHLVWNNDIDCQMGQGTLAYHPLNALTSRSQRLLPWHSPHWNRFPFLPRIDLLTYIYYLEWKTRWHLFHRQKPARLADEFFTSALAVGQHPSPFLRVSGHMKGQREALVLQSSASSHLQSHLNYPSNSLPHSHPIIPEFTTGILQLKSYYF